MLRGGSGESGLPVQDHWNVWSPVFASLCKRFDDISLARSIFLEICAFLSSRVLCKVLVWSLSPSNSSKKSVFFLCFLHQLHLSVSLKYIIFLFLTKTDSYQICLPNVLNVFFFLKFLRPWTVCEPVIWNSVFWKLTYLIKLAEKQLFLCSTSIEDTELPDSYFRVLCFVFNFCGLGIDFVTNGYVHLVSTLNEHISTLSLLWL